MSLRELAMAWAKANCASKDVKNEFLKRLDDALQRGVGCSFTNEGARPLAGGIAWSQATKP